MPSADGNFELVLAHQHEHTRAFIAQRITEIVQEATGKESNINAVARWSNDLLIVESTGAQVDGVILEVTPPNVGV